MKCEIKFVDSDVGEPLKALRIDQENITRVIADMVGKSLDEVLRAIRESATLTQTLAKGFGLVHEIHSDSHPAGIDLVVIG